MSHKKHPPVLAKCPRCERRHQDFGTIKWTGSGLARIYCERCRYTINDHCDGFFIDGFRVGGSLRVKGAAP
jgi:hypothetical protein